MHLLESIRNKTPEQKMRIIWTIVAVAAVILILLWIFTSKIYSDSSADISIFHTIGKGVKDVQSSFKK